MKRIFRVSCFLAALCYPLSAQECQVLIYRPWTSSGGSVKLGVLVDGKKLANPKGGESVPLSLECGKHVFSLTHFEGIQVPAELDSKQTSYVRVERPWGWVQTAHIELVDSNRARAEIDFVAKHKK